MFVGGLKDERNVNEYGFGVLKCSCCDGFSLTLFFFTYTLSHSSARQFKDTKLSCENKNKRKRKTQEKTKRCLKCPAAAPVPKKRIKYRTQQVLCALFLSSLDTDLLLLASLASFSQKLRLQACRENATLQRLSNDNDTELQR